MAFNTLYQAIIKQKLLGTSVFQEAGLVANPQLDKLLAGAFNLTQNQALVLENLTNEQLTPTNLRFNAQLVSAWQLHNVNAEISINTTNETNVTVLITIPWPTGATFGTYFHYLGVYPFAPFSALMSDPAFIFSSQTQDNYGYKGQTITLIQGLNLAAT